jgi:hypothetical protein
VISLWWVDVFLESIDLRVLVCSGPAAWLPTRMQLRVCGDEEEWQGLTPVHISAQPEPFLTQTQTPKRPKIPLINPLITLSTTPERNPFPTVSAYVELKSGQVKAPEEWLFEDWARTDTGVNGDGGGMMYPGLTTLKGATGGVQWFRVDNTRANPGVPPAWQGLADIAQYVIKRVRTLVS